MSRCVASCPSEATVDSSGSSAQGLAQSLDVMSAQNTHTRACTVSIGNVVMCLTLHPAAVVATLGKRGAVFLREPAPSVSVGHTGNIHTRTHAHTQRERATRHNAALPLALTLSYFSQALVRVVKLGVVVGLLEQGCASCRCVEAVSTVEGPGLAPPALCIVSQGRRDGVRRPGAGEANKTQPLLSARRASVVTSASFSRVCSCSWIDSPFARRPAVASVPRKAPYMDCWWFKHNSSEM